MSISMQVLQRNLKHPIWLIGYVPTTKEKIWFGYIHKNKKTGNLSFKGGRRPDSQSRSGNTQEEAMRRLCSYLTAALKAWTEYNK